MTNLWLRHESAAGRVHGGPAPRDASFGETALKVPVVLVVQGGVERRVLLCGLI